MGHMPPSQPSAEEPTPGRTLSSMKWERVEPVKPCTSPDGHDSHDFMSMRSCIPERVICPRCGEDWQVVLLPEDAE